MLDNIDIKYFKLAVGQENIGKETKVDISSRCPVCGDSRTKKSSKRLHLYIKNGKTKCNCFNGDCSVQNKSMYSFLYSYYPSLIDNYKRETFFNNIDNLKQTNSGDVFSNIKESTVQNTQKEEKCPVTFHNLFNYFDTVMDSSEAIKYLHSRGLDYFNTDYEWYFGIQDLKIGDKIYKLKDSIIIPLYYENNMYGFYSRNIYKKEFFTYMPECNVGYKIWNWFNIDKDEEVLVTEGIFDCLSINYNNKIALMGAKIPEERLSELKDLVFVLDNDKTGILNSIDYAKRGYKVFIQPDKYKEKDMNALKLNNPRLDIYRMIKENTYSGISAAIRLRQKL